MVIKMVTLNIWHGYLLDSVIAFLGQQNADIVTLQEVFNGDSKALPPYTHALRRLREELGYGYHFYAPSYKDTSEQVEEGGLVLSRFPIKKTDSVFVEYPYRELDGKDPANFPTMPRLLQNVEVETPACLLNVINFHGVWDLNGDNDSPQRRLMTQAILDAVKDKDRVIVAGDSNAKPTNPAFGLLDEQLNSVFGNTLKSTFNMRRKDNPGYAAAAVDMMFVSKNIQVLQKDCPDVDVSDHLPLVASLDLS
jgi:endonuclease/exonuclease/phosphatase family metal-dependent hydrolase